jgi:uncharacterized tellurite resistance protein B-like protein
MGLLGKIFGSTPAEKATDDVPLLHGMLAMAGCDGSIEDKEAETVEAFFATLPEFNDKEFSAFYNEARKLIAKHGGVKESVAALRELSSANLKRKCFILAADIALSSGDVDENEEKMLEAMQRILEVDDATANRIVEVLGMKYTTS